MIVVYQSFEGEYGDSPQVLFERLRRRRPADTHVWLAAPSGRVDFPDDVNTVAIYTDEGRELLESADLLIANTHTDTPWRKRPGAHYLQTWHGTPLKRIHHDVRWAPPGRLDRLDLDVARWDMLLSPNAASTPRLRRAFRFAGPVAETGYPRNDVLSHPDAPRLRAQARRDLGLGEDIRAVLYLPTWRDDDVFSGREGPGPGAAAVPRLLAGLGDDAVLLHRCHSFDAGRHVSLDHPRMRDVSSWPDVSLLYLAADVLVTDFSSAMFDFAVTGKPLLHFVPDYESFRDTVRGTYVDLEQLAPGPLLRTEDDVVRFLDDEGWTDARYAERYVAFRDRYCAQEDGHATERVLELLGRAVPALAGAD